MLIGIAAFGSSPKEGKTVEELRIRPQQRLVVRSLGFLDAPTQSGREHVLRGVNGSASALGCFGLQILEGGDRFLSKPPLKWDRDNRCGLDLASRQTRERLTML